MLKKLLPLFFLVVFHFLKAQNEFITIWKPSGVDPSITTYTTAPTQSSPNQIWFPGTGSNYTIQWEEINYPQHNGILTNVTSNGQILINFGTPLNPAPNQATYSVKVSNGSGVFNKIQFASFTLNPNGVKIWSHLGNSDKILAISQWGNIQWTSMFNAFSHCQSLQLTATDSPNLSNVENASHLFFNASSFTGNSSMANWNTSQIKDFSFMFAHENMYLLADTFNPPIGNWNTSAATNFKSLFENRQVFNQNLNSWNTSNVTNMNSTFAICTAFNQPLVNWNTSNVTDMSFMFHFIPNFNQSLNSWNTSKVTNMASMFEGCTIFNQPLQNWNTSNVTNMNSMFANCNAFNQPLDNWNTSNVTDMSLMFHVIPNFNQPLNSWDTSNVTNISHMFHSCTAFNQPLDNWDTSKVTNMSFFLQNATAFNQTLGNWNLPLLTNAVLAITQTGIDCGNYSDTLTGWADNPNTTNNINLGPLMNLTYSSTIINKRNILINKGWTFTGDVAGECEKLAVGETKLESSLSIYPNPASDFIYLNNSKDAKSYIITDISGRIVMKNSLTKDFINIQSLSSGNYILQILTSKNIENLKFIKK
ncbi:BspA family leucine-rich repeat surface protein [Chryseobacterium turcicum]|uniref:BspA family leucine-rich repeat surface protein n=1 Tax=Chryseobacterium turcicum TaxID=2898076 RepID=A0A9Q3V6I8_9FLAO|nr:BspA family leucine-rich repeat surface protein [Chryseobacterium turcicum]MCD1118280.1 BspA family leucine-rich repeat surface protein [Chryseobacterium turcicum]